MSQIIKQYESPHQFEPLMPQEAKLEPLLERASDLARAATALGVSAAGAVHVELKALLRNMNSYYTNRMEGEHTRPSDIERALVNDFSGNAGLARKQRLAVAHIQTEHACEQIIHTGQLQAHDFGTSLYSAESIKTLHRMLFENLPEQDRKLVDGTLLIPGELRHRQVSVGRHEAPAFTALPQFIDRWAQFYGGVRRGEASIVAAAAAHHRLTWMHPFLDGNGRVARLHTHLLMHSMGLTSGLWSPLRGFARTEDRYKSLLQAADEHRRGDLDGRGNLTQSGLIEWTKYTIDVCIDQVEFMSKQLDVGVMRDRMSACLAFEEDVVKSGVRKEALMPLHYLFSAQNELGRAEFKTMTGLGDRVAVDALSALIKRGFLASDSPYGKVRFAIPTHALRFYFPALWPEAEQDQALLESERRETNVAAVVAPSNGARRRKP